MSAVEAKTCCAAAYASEAARWLLGDSFHPGGAGLTSRLASALAAGPGDLVVDVGSGRGTSAIQVARETGCHVLGVELAAELVEQAQQAAREAGLAATVRFRQGDAEALPLGDHVADGVLCECSFCLFPDKETAAAELARVLRAGGRLALADIVADSQQLPAELTSLAGWVSCLGGAGPLEETATLFEEAGLRIEALERHDEALAALLDRVEARLRLARRLDGDLAARGLELAAAARDALEGGALGYGVVVANRPLDR